MYLFNAKRQAFYNLKRNGFTSLQVKLKKTYENKQVRLPQYECISGIFVRPTHLQGYF